MSNFIKKYDVGNIMVDLPYNSYIHQLPLLSFSDFRNSVKISLVFNQKLKLDNDNSFNIGKGYKLNIQKKILKDSNNKPVKVIEANGKYTNLINNGSTVYTFDDDSKRVLRVLSSGYEIEYEDFSKEVYNSLGYLTATYDKYQDPYLTYTYTNSLLTKVTYNGKEVNFSYYNNSLSTISYGSTTTSVVYNDPDITITHYSGIRYFITITNTKYSVKGIPADSSETMYKIKECEYSGNTMELRYKVLTDTVDNIVYTFPSSVTNGYQLYNYVYITDKNQVETKLQFNDDKPLYSYEVDFESEQVQFHNDKCVSDVQIYNTLNNSQANVFKGVLAYNMGMQLIKNTNGNLWQIQTQNDEEVKQSYLVTGWAKSSTSGNKNINITSNKSNFNESFQMNINTVFEWNFFAYQVDVTGNTVIVSHNYSDLELKDVRILLRATDIDTSKKTDYAPFKEDILINSDTNAPISFNDVDFFYGTEGGDGLATLTFSDLLRYFRRKIKFNKSDEIYCNDGKNVINEVVIFKVRNKATGAFEDISEYGVGYRQYLNGKEYETRVMKYDSTTSPFIIINNIDKSYESYSYLSIDLDANETHKENIHTYYTRDKGLVTRENCSGIHDLRYTYDTVNNTIFVKDEFENNYMYSGVTYYMDPVWGTIYKKQTSNATKVEDTYDDDMSTILQKEFNNQSTGIKHLYNYSKGNLSSLSCSDLNYTFDYSKDKLVKTTKFNLPIEECVHTETSSTIYCPSVANTLYNKQYNYDKYNRLLSITNELENTYNVSSSFDETTGELITSFDNKNSKLVMSEDKVDSKKIRYKYNDIGLLGSKEVTNSSNYNTKVSNETFSYDKKGRLQNKIINYPSSNLIVEDEITYLKTEEDLNGDNRVQLNTYNINNTLASSVENTYDNQNRLTKKIINTNNLEAVKDVAYNNERVSSESNKMNGTEKRLSTYSYDLFDRIISITSGNKTITYEYDIYGRLVRENNQPLDKTIVYSYNDIGNIVTNTTYEYTVATNPETLISSKSYVYDSVNKDRLTSFSSTTIPYNIAGCPTKYKGYDLSWNKGKLSAMSKGDSSSGSESYSFYYNAYGQRVKKLYIKTAGMNLGSSLLTGELSRCDITYKYDHLGRLINEKKVSTYYNAGQITETINYIYDVNSIIGMQYTKGSTTNIYYFDRNILGDVVAIYDTSGNLKVKYLYDAYGNCTISSETTDQSLAKANPIRYRGYYYDVETGLFWISSRYYDPEWCRWISPDDIEYLDPESVNGLNLYCYCKNDPVNYVDPSGHSVIQTVFSLFDLAITYASSMIGNAVTFIGASVATATTLAATSFELATTTAIAVATSILPIVVKTYINKFLKKSIEKWCVDNKKEIKLFIYKIEYAIKRFFRKEPSVINQWLESNDPSQREGMTGNIARFSNEAGGSLKSYLDCYDMFNVDDEVDILQ